MNHSPHPHVEVEESRAGGAAGTVRYARRVSDDEKGIVDRISRQGEEALGRLAEELVGNPVVSRAISSAFEAREKAVLAQEAAMGALNIPSAADIERLTRRLRSVSQRLEGIEDALDRLEQKAQAVAKAAEQDGAQDLSPRLDEIAEDLAKLREAVAPAAEPVPRAQERLTVNDSAA
jgi:chromosome segregation ATPase